MALGASRKRVIEMVLRGAFLQIGIGLALGIPTAIGAETGEMPMAGTCPYSRRSILVAATWRSFSKARDRCSRLGRTGNPSARLRLRYLERLGQLHHGRPALARNLLAGMKPPT